MCFILELMIIPRNDNKLGCTRMAQEYKTLNFIKAVKQ